MNYYAKHAASQAALQRRLGEDCPGISWNDKDWAIVPRSAKLRRDLAPGGFQLNGDLKFDVLVAQFLSSTITDAVALKDRMLNTEIGYLGEKFKAVQMDVLPGGLMVTVECNSLNQRA
jgi:hypothetical protein